MITLPTTSSTKPANVKPSSREVLRSCKNNIPPKVEITTLNCV